VTAKVINLRRARKTAARAETAVKADENAARHGQSKAQKKLTSAREAKAVRALDGHKRDG
jgi:hypothetical protein